MPNTPLKPLKSPCHDADLYSTLADGVVTGWCERCRIAVVRIHPKTRVEEWLDGRAPWYGAPDYTESLRPVQHEQQHERSEEAHE